MCDLTEDETAGTIPNKIVLTEQVVEDIDNPPTINKKLADAAKRYKEMGNEP